MVRWIRQWIKRRRIKNAENERRLAEIDAEVEKEMLLNEAREREVLDLSNEQAKERFFMEVDAGAFEVEYAPAENIKVLSVLPSDVCELLSKVARVTVEETNCVFDRKEIVENILDPWGDLDFVYLTAIHSAIVVKPAQNGIYYLGDGEAEETLIEMEPDYPTIYHCLLCRPDVS